MHMQDEQVATIEQLINDMEAASSRKDVEYRTASSDTDKFSVDIIEVRDGKIQSLRAYAGWRAIVAEGPADGVAS